MKKDKLSATVNPRRLMLCRRMLLMEQREAEQLAATTGTVELGWLTLNQTTFKNNFRLNVISIELLATISAVDVNKIC